MERKSTYTSEHDFFVERRLTIGPNDMATQHYHDAYEIYLQMKGKRYLFCGENTYLLDEGDLVIFEPFETHGMESKEEPLYERYVLNFQSKMLEPILTPREIEQTLAKLKQCVVHLDEERYSIVLSAYDGLRYWDEKGGFLHKKMVAAMLLGIIRTVEDVMDKSTPVSGEKCAPQIITAMRYIRDHYTENVSLDTISSVVHMSKYHFCRLFRDGVGMTFLEYLNVYRMSKVHQLLLETDMSLEQIAEKVGIASAANMARIFKKGYGESPSVFRKKNKADKKK